jgi:hypothetical protein
MTIVALPAAQRRSSSSPTTRRSTNPMSSRPPQTLSSRRAHTRRSHPRPRKSAPCSLLTITSAAFHPRHHMGDPSATPKSRPAKPRLFLPAVSSLRGFRTPAPRPVPASPAKRRRPKPFSQADIRELRLPTHPTCRFDPNSWRHSGSRSRICRSCSELFDRIWRGGGLARVIAPRTLLAAIGILPHRLLFYPKA